MPYLLTDSRPMYQVMLQLVFSFNGTEKFLSLSFAYKTKNGEREGNHFSRCIPTLTRKLHKIQQDKGQEDI